MRDTKLERMINEGHIVGNHTSSHPSLPNISDEEIEKEIMDLHQAVYKKFNYEMKTEKRLSIFFSE